MPRRSSYGQGTAPQLVGEWLKVTNKLDIGSVSYRGGMQAITDMLGGTIHLNIGTASTLVPLIQEGKLRAISVWGPTRFPELPEVPTMIESGFPGLSLWFWAGLWAGFWAGRWADSGQPLSRLWAIPVGSGAGVGIRGGVSAPRERRRACLYNRSDPRRAGR